MDLKEWCLFNHYKKFTKEYSDYIKKYGEDSDINTRHYNTINNGEMLSFRSNNKVNDNNLENILEFANLVAHRERTRGKILNCIKAAKDNNYNVINKKVEGYSGIREQEWYREWKKLCVDNKI